MIVTIDGPAGSGKSTVARQLAARLGLPHLDTGATYRAATLCAVQAGVDLADTDALVRCTAAAEIRLEPTPDGNRVYLDGCEVTADIRGSDVTDAVRFLANSPPVRQILVDLQRRIGQSLGAFVTEGRDQGSAVFPDADIKFFLTAGADVRAHRRLTELQADGEDVAFEQVRQAIIDRDHSDRSRAVGPLVKPRGAIEIDTSEMDARQVVNALVRHVEDARA